MRGIKMAFKKSKVVTPVSTGSMMESMTQRFESDMAELEAQLMAMKL